MIDLVEAMRDRSAPGAAERVRALSYAQNARLEAAVADALRAMGSTATEVASTVRVRGIKGWPGSSRTCPVAQYLSTLFTQFYVETYSTAVSMRDGGPVGDVVVWVDMPDPVSEFIAGFDSGWKDHPYPDLIVAPTRPAVSIVDAP